MAKCDAYLTTVFDKKPDTFQHPMLVRVLDYNQWVSPVGFEELCNIGIIISGRGTLAAIQLMIDDPNVLGIEASR